MKRQQIQQGFTLIELMIVVAIVGILAAIAIPAYQDYTKRARVTEGLALADSAKTAVTEYYASNNAFVASGTAPYNTSYGLATTITGSSVGSLSVLASGVIQVAYNSTVSSGALLDLVPTVTSGSVSWVCTYTGTGGGTTAIAAANQLSANWVPSTCRQ
ncbi:pilin [Chromobacterium subtsugae]|uniref:Pilin n=1 Tax=Chromobacterium subtsugae TaxID=251747 RepID=A0ABS7F904_9NEIS|nr:MULTISPECIES: pilin [Chromobacterium]KUM03129.1 fimbrial protein [Chromobacterium subtsugae]KZE86554.1 fimbrial protein [Chromobacterium sp. F49]MBW7564977.1 pilin [Chromobacterium subtsugae]MBW8286496.1 pilin [Chromobacterium subtsugae]OBU87670.1 fimbrial protein [Chromobacterium subtsugae]